MNIVKNPEKESAASVYDWETMELVGNVVLRNEEIAHFSCVSSFQASLALTDTQLQELNLADTDLITMEAK